MDYLKIAKHYEKCLDEHGDTCKGVDWPNEEDANLRYKIMLELLPGFYQATLLDFGCGTGKLLEYIIKNNINIDYQGLDVSDKYITLCRDKYPNVKFHKLDVCQNDLSQKYDYIICNGTFTEKVDLPWGEMWKFFTQALKTLWKNTEKGIAFNVMSKYVDWERNDLFHVDTKDICDFLIENLSRNFIIRNDYGLYEYTVYVYRKPKWKI